MLNVFLAASLALALGPGQSRATGDIGTAAKSTGPISLQVGAFKISAEVAAEPDQRARGLMYRESLAPDSGMVFVFERPERICMWMKNTPLPLTVAFIDAGGEIINLADMRPRTETPHCAMRPALYALEMEQGWFERRGIGPGKTIKGLTQLRQP
jgi:uncharacterized membrane protein (UPF0127 family)